MHPNLQPANSFREPEVRHLQPGDHHCHVFETTEQSLMVLGPFLAGGLDAGDRCVVTLAETPTDDVREALEEKGVDTEARIAEGDLLFRPAHESYGGPGSFDVCERIDELEAMVNQAREEGYENLRSAGEMTWAAGELDRETLSRYEAELNRFFESETGEHMIGLCQYPLSVFEPGVAADVLRAHPLTIHGTQVRPNLFYQPPDVLLADDPRAELDHMLDRLTGDPQPGESARQLLEDLEDRIDRLQRFQETVSEEMEDNLQALKAHLQQLEDDIDKPWAGRAETSIAFAVEGAGRIEERIRALVEYGRVESEGLEVSTVDSGEVLAQARSNLEARLDDAGVEITHDPLVSLEADHDRLVFLFEQLLGYVLQHGGPELARIHVGVEAEEGACRFSIEDDGQGLSVGKRERIVDALDRGQPPGSSTEVGLELGLCGRIVDRHGGRFSVAPSSREGVRFAFTIREPNDHRSPS